MSFLVKKLPSWVSDLTTVISGFSLMSLGFLIFFTEFIEWGDILISPFYASGYGFTVYFFIIALKIIIELALVIGLFDSIKNIIRGTHGF